MRHRSPDGMAVDDAHFSMGMGRLAIVGETPFPFRYKDLCVVMNGEIYNWKELALDLINVGHTFETNCDLEVVAHAFDEWGFECVEHFRGMFAIGVRTPDGVFIARDAAGEKPLYYSTNPFHFASENKALFFTGSELPHGHYLWHDIKANTVETVKWWNYEPEEIDWKHPEEVLESLLKRAVERMIPDVPYALYLSSGVDSTLLSTFLPADTPKYTYVDKDYKEQFLADFEKIVYHLDYPIDSFSAFPLYCLAGAARENGIKVVLSGEGADELFSGYVRYVPNALMLKGQDEFPSYKAMFPYKGDLGWIDFNNKMQGLLRMGDRMAGAWGVENRCPYLDRDVIEFAYSLPMKNKAYGYDTKIILRNILKKRKPDYQFEEKHGLYASVNEWLGGGDKLSKGKYLERQFEIWTKYL